MEREGGKTGAQPTYLVECLNVCALNMPWIIKPAANGEQAHGGVAHYPGCARVCVCVLHGV